MRDAAMVLESDHWTGQIKQKVEIGELCSDDQRHRRHAPIALSESCLCQQGTRESVGEIIHQYNPSSCV